MEWGLAALPCRGEADVGNSAIGREKVHSLECLTQGRINGGALRRCDKVQPGALDRRWEPLDLGDLHMPIQNVRGRNWSWGLRHEWQPDGHQRYFVRRAVPRRCDKGKDAERQSDRDRGEKSA